MITHTQQSYPWHIVYAQHPTDGRTIAIRVGELGYHPVRTPMSIVDLNGPRIEERHVQAALAGSAFGWHVPAADPDHVSNLVVPVTSELSRSPLMEHVVRIVGEAKSFLALQQIAKEKYEQHADQPYIVAVLRNAFPELSRSAHQDPLFYVQLATRGNPDLGQDPARIMHEGPPDTWLRVGNAIEATRVVRQFCDLYHVGGGNWFGGELRDSRNQVVGGVSFNGRINSLQDHNRFSTVGPRA